MQLMDALLGKTIEKEFNLGGKSLILRTLTQTEMNEVMAKLPRMDLSMLEFQKIPILSRSIVSIDKIDKAAFSDIQDAITDKVNKVSVIEAMENMLGKMDTTIINLLYSFYSLLVEEANKQRESLKSF